jgi:hypothetical protein
MFGFGKKKQSTAMPELPPPPSPPGSARPQGDIPAITAPETHDDLPELPEMPRRSVDLPEPPAPEMPEMPAHEDFPAPEPVKEFEMPQPQSERPDFPELMPAESHDAPAFEQRETVRRSVGPAFVSVDDYRTIMEHSNRVREKLAEAEQFVHRLHEIKAEEESVFEKWRGQLEDVERKLGHIDRVIAKAKR